MADDLHALKRHAHTNAHDLIVHVEFQRGDRRLSTINRGAATLSCAKIIVAIAGFQDDGPLAGFGDLPTGAKAQGVGQAGGTVALKAAINPGRQAVIGPGPLSDFVVGKAKPDDDKRIEGGVFAGASSGE
ncbi:hypothetical protein C8029_18075 [Roseobacter sp. TSBP12]|nr:hypothetical protein C8029_18075 [Roseobacter sp. TSBP12]